MVRRRREVTYDRKPRLPPAASEADLLARGRGEKQLARVALVLLVPVLATSVASLLHDLDFALLSRTLATDPGSVSPARILSMDERAETVLLLPLVASLPFAIVFLVWMHRAFHNAHWLGAGRWMAFSPSQAAFSFFIPFRNLFRPLQAFHELAAASDPFELEEPPRAPDSTAGYREAALEPLPEQRAFRSPPLGAWWATWLGAHLLGFLGTRMAHGPSLDFASDGGWVLVVSDVLALLSAGLVGLVVHTIDRRREEVYRRIGAELAPVVPEVTAEPRAAHA